MQLSKCKDFMLWDRYLIRSSNTAQKKKIHTVLLNHLHSFEAYLQ